MWPLTFFHNIGFSLDPSGHQCQARPKILKPQGRDGQAEGQHRNIRVSSAKRQTVGTRPLELQESRWHTRQSFLLVQQATQCQRVLQYVSPTWHVLRLHSSHVKSRKNAWDRFKTFSLPQCVFFPLLVFSGLIFCTFLLPTNFWNNRRLCEFFKI